MVSHAFISVEVVVKPISCSYLGSVTECFSVCLVSMIITFIIILILIEKQALITLNGIIKFLVLCMVKYKKESIHYYLNVAPDFYVLYKSENHSRPK